MKIQIYLLVTSKVQVEKDVRVDLKRKLSLNLSADMKLKESDLNTGALMSNKNSKT